MRCYEFLDVATAVFEDLEAAPSKRPFICTHIKGTYRYEPARLPSNARA
jgi:hypothetical protein